MHLANRLLMDTAKRGIYRLRKSPKWNVRIVEGLRILTDKQFVEPFH